MRSIAEIALPAAALAAVLALAVPPEGGVPPSLLVHGGALLLGAAALWRLDRLPRALDPLLAAAFALAAEHRLLTVAGVPWGHDARLHLWGAAALGEALRAGQWPPLWLHPLAAGVPLLQFYPPLGFASLVLGQLAGLELHAAFRLTFVLFAVVGAMGVRWAIWEWTADRRAALVAAAAFALAPFRLFDGHVRSALGESAALAVLPFVALGLQRVLRRPRSGAVSLGVAAAALALTHLLTAVLAAYGALAWWIAHTAAHGRSALRRARESAAGLAGAGALALALAAWFLVPLLADLDATSVRRITPAAARFASPGMQPLDWLGAPRSVGEEEVRRRQRARHFERAPVLPFGATLLAGVLLAGWRAAPRRRFAGAAAVPANGDRRLLVGVVAMTAVGLAVTLEVLTPATARLPALRALQFPYRGLTLATAGASLCVGLALAGADRDRRRRLAAALFLVAAVFEGAYYTGVERWVGPWSELAKVVPVPAAPGRFTAEPLASAPRRVTGQVVPPSGSRAALVTGLAEAFIEYSRPEVFALRRHAWERLGVGLAVPPGGGEVALRPRRYAEWIGEGGRRRGLAARVGGGRVLVAAPAAAGTVVAREQCFPGWRQRFGDDWRPAACSADGFLQAEGAGREPVEWRFFPWSWPRVLGWIVSALTAAGLLARFGAARRSRRPAGEAAR